MLILKKIVSFDCYKGCYHLMKSLFLFILLFSQFTLFAQNIKNYEKPPIFPECELQPIADLMACFNNNINQFIFENFKLPQVVNDKNYKGDVKVLFEVDKEGKINVLYVEAIYDELKNETRRVFGELPQVQPSTYNGKPAFVQYSISIKIPTIDPATIQNEVQDDESIKQVRELNETVSQEYDSINKSIIKYEDLEYSSN